MAQSDSGLFNTKNHLIGDLYEDYRDHTVFNPKLLVKTRDVSSKASPIRRIVFHCTDSEGWSPQRLSEFFVSERGFPVCGYHYYVTKDKIYHMVGENIVTYHAGGYNTASVGFSIGYFASRDEATNIKLNPVLYDNAVSLATYLCLKFHVIPKKTFPYYSGLVGHRELPGTGFFKDKQDHIHLRKTCPGMAIDLDVFRYKVARKIQDTLNASLPVDSVKLAVDGIFGPKTEKAFVAYTY